MAPFSNRVERGYRFLDHATDAVVEAEGKSMREAFAAAADAAVDLTLDRDSVAEGGHVEIRAEGEDLSYLLYSWLEEVVFALITRGFAIRRVEIDKEASSDLDAAAVAAAADGSAATIASAAVEPLVIRAKAYGEPLDLGRHGFKLEIKAPTFHEMSIKRSEAGASVRFLLDL